MIIFTFKLSNIILNFKAEKVPYIFNEHFAEIIFYFKIESIHFKFRYTDYLILEHFFPLQCDELITKYYIIKTC